MEGRKSEVISSKCVGTGNCGTVSGRWIRGLRHEHVRWNNCVIEKKWKISWRKEKSLADNTRNLMFVNSFGSSAEILKIQYFFVYLVFIQKIQKKCFWSFLVNFKVLWDVKGL